MGKFLSKCGQCGCKPMHEHKPGPKHRLFGKRWYSWFECECGNTAGCAGEFYDATEAKESARKNWNSLNHRDAATLRLIAALECLGAAERPGDEHRQSTRAYICVGHDGNIEALPEPPNEQAWGELWAHGWVEWPT